MFSVLCLAFYTWLADKAKKYNWYWFLSIFLLNFVQNYRLTVFHWDLNRLILTCRMFLISNIFGSLTYIEILIKRKSKKAQIVVIFLDILNSFSSKANGWLDFFHESKPQSTLFLFAEDFSMTVFSAVFALNFPWLKIPKCAISKDCCWLSKSFVSKQLLQWNPLFENKRSDVSSVHIPIPFEKLPGVLSSLNSVLCYLGLNFSNKNFRTSHENFRNSDQIPFLGHHTSHSLMLFKVSLLLVKTGRSFKNFHIIFCLECCWRCPKCSKHLPTNVG